MPTRPHAPPSSIPAAMARTCALLSALLCAGLALLLPAAPALAADEIRVVQVRPGTSTLKGRLRGRETLDYRLRAATGQDLMVSLRTSNRSAYFNVLPPGGGEALFVGSTSGDRYRGVMPRDGEVTVRVYLMRNAARRNEQAGFTLSLKLDGDADAARTGPTHYHANGRVRCEMGEAQAVARDELDGECAFRALRDRAARTAEVWIDVPPGEGRPRQRVLRFAAGAFSTPEAVGSGDAVSAAREDDNWRVQVGAESYLLPDALIHGG